MKYLIRSIKYLLFITVIFALLIGVVFLASKEATSIESLFVPGALPKIAIFFVIVAAIYPMFGYIRKEAHLNKEYSDVKDVVDNIFSTAGYRVASEDHDKIVYESSKPLVRFMRLYEDQIILNKSENPIVLEGGRKDVYRLIRTIEYKINRDENS